MTLVMRQIGLVSFFLLLLGGPAVVAQVYDCAAPTSVVSFSEVFNQVGQGLEYTDDGEIVRAYGKSLSLDSTPRNAFFNYVARNNPTVTVQVFVKCQSCDGQGGSRRIDRKGVLDLGRIVDEICTTCRGSKGSTQSMTLTVTYSGKLPPMPASPKLIAFRGKLNSARDGNASAQVEVAKAYLDGRFVTRSVSDAREWYTKAAIQGQQDAFAPLAQLYLDPSNTFQDYAYGLALSAVADPTIARADGPEFVAITESTSVATTPEAGYSHYLQVLEAGLLVPRIAQGLQDKTQAEKMLSPELIRKSFALKAPLSAEARADKRALFVRGVARYLGFGFSTPDRSEGLRLIEEAACKQDADSFLMIALHYDTAKEYTASEPTAWAFYSLARSLGSSNPFCLTRLSKLAETDVAVDWAGAPEALLAYLQQGRFTPAVIRDLADLSLYRVVRPASAAPGIPNPFDTAATQETPLSKAQVFSKARSMLLLKLRVVEITPDDECVFRKCWDDGTSRYYSVSGIVTFTNTGSHKETAPFTICFKAADAASAPTLLYCSAGSFLFGEFPPECGRRP